MMQTPPRVLVLALGNPDRGDDGVGPAVANSLRKLLPRDVTIMSVGGDVLGVVPTWTEFDAVICVDAAAPSGRPGRIHRFDLAAGDLPRDLTVTSSHAFGLAEAIALARALNQAPRAIIVYAIEGASFAASAPLTPEVAAATAEVAGRVAAEVNRLRLGQVAVGVAVGV